MFKTRLRISKPGSEARFRRLSHKFGKPWSLTDCAWMHLALFVYSNLTNTGYPKIVNKCDSGVWGEVQLAGLHVYLWGLGIRWVYVAFVLVIHPLLFVKNMRFWVQIPCCTSMTQEALNLPGDAAAMKLMFALHSCNLAVILAPQGPCRCHGAMVSPLNHPYHQHSDHPHGSTFLVDFGIQKWMQQMVVTCCVLLLYF